MSWRMLTRRSFSRRPRPRNEPSASSLSMAAFFFNSNYFGFVFFIAGREQCSDCEIRTEYQTPTVASTPLAVAYPPLLGYFPIPGVKFGWPPASNILLKLCIPPIKILIQLQQFMSAIETRSPVFSTVFGSLKVFGFLAMMGVPGSPRAPGFQV